MSDQNDSSYKRLKEKYDKLLKEIGNDTKNLSTIQDMGIRDNGIPDFLYSSDMDKKLDAYLRKNPKSAEFIYRKYQENRSIIKDICNPIPGNPLYVKEVADLLSGYFQYEDIKVEVSRLKSERMNLQDDVSAFKEERDSLKKETDDLSKTLDTKKKELEDIQKQLINIHETTGLDRIMNFIQSVQDTTKTVLSRGLGEGFSGNSLILNIDKVMKIEEISRSASELKKYLATEDFLSPIKLDEEKQKALDEYEQATHDYQGWMDRNPIKKFEKINDFIELGLRQLHQLANRKEILRPGGESVIAANIEDAQKMVSELQIQINMAKQVKK